MDKQIIRLFTSLIAIALVAVSISSCSVNSSPNETELKSYIQTQLPGGLKLQEFRYQNFAHKSLEGKGRSSVSGMLELTRSRFIVSKDALKNDLLAEGFTLREINYFKPDRGLPTVYIQSNLAGEVIPFTAEINYAATVDGFQFNGKPRYKVTGYTSHKAQIVHNSPVYNRILKEILARRAAYLRKEQKSKIIVENYFSSEDGYTYYGIEDWNKNLYNKRFSMSLSGPLKFDKTSANKLNFYVPAVAEWLTDGRWANSRYKQGDRIHLRLSGTIKGNQGKKNISAEFPINLTISVPDGRGGFYSAGDTMQMRNGVFVRMAGVSGRIGGRLVRQMKKNQLGSDTDSNTYTKTKDVKKYKSDSDIQTVVQRNWLLPRSVATKGLSCTVNVRVKSDGTILKVDVVKSSGNETFDRSAIAAVMKSEPLPVLTDSNEDYKFRDISLRF